MTDKTREDFEVWAQSRHLNLAKVDGMYRSLEVTFAFLAYQTATQQSAARIAALEAERAEFLDASKVNLENYEFQRRKADAATATVYQFHYAMKDAGWHPGRTDDNLCGIIRAKGAELAKLEAELLALRKDAERLNWLIDGAGRRIAIDSFGGQCRIVDPTVSLVVTDWYATKREAIDAAIEAERGEG